jgi:two-component system sensor histidine kinase HydH
MLGLAAGMAASSLLLRRRHRLVLLRSERRADEIRSREQAALVGTIASGIAHEIRNPLSTLRMNLQLLREDWENPITEREQKGRRRIDVLLRETERMESVVADFVRFATGTALRRERTSLGVLAGELLDFLAPQAERGRIRLHRDLAPDLPTVDADANLLRQALLHLLVNAQQVQPDGGAIRVRTRLQDGEVRLSVADEGPGIPPEHRDKIFNLYFSTRPGGTGLGLPMVKKIVEEHGGRIDLETELHKGTTFTICLKPSAS